jgi:hypothetical protein
MDASYLEIGTEVIVVKPRIHQESKKWFRGTIVSLTKWRNQACCTIAGDSYFLWFPEELILASDEELLRPEDRGGG